MGDFFKNQWKGAAKLLASAAVGSLLTLYIAPAIDFAKDNRKDFALEISKMNDSSQSFLGLLDAYSKASKGGPAVDDKTQDAFNRQLETMNAQATVIYRREPTLEREYYEYQRSLLDLHDAAHNLRGPLDGGNKFWAAVDQYSTAQDKFTQKANELQKSLIHSLVAGLT